MWATNAVTDEDRLDGRETRRVIRRAVGMAHDVRGLALATLGFVGFPGQSEHPFADRVAQHLVGAAGQLRDLYLYIAHYCLSGDRPRRAAEL